jgi:hypothetical protein
MFGLQMGKVLGVQFVGNRDHAVVERGVVGLIAGDKKYRNAAWVKSEEDFGGVLTRSSFMLENREPFTVSADGRRS